MSDDIVSGKVVMPRHIAIVMDGNGRWAKKRFLPRVAGHAKGVEAIRRTIEGCISRGIPYLTVFAFSSENWSRPSEEVGFLMNLFLSTLEKETDRFKQYPVECHWRYQPFRFESPGGDCSGTGQDIGQHGIDIDGMCQLWRTVGHTAGGQENVARWYWNGGNDRETTRFLSCAVLRS